MHKQEYVNKSSSLPDLHPVVEQQSSFTTRKQSFQTLQPMEYSLTSSLDIHGKGGIGTIKKVREQAEKDLIDLRIGAPKNWRNSSYDYLTSTH